MIFSTVEDVLNADLTEYHIPVSLLKFDRVYISITDNGVVYKIVRNIILDMKRVGEINLRSDIDVVQDVKDIIHHTRPTRSTIKVYSIFMEHSPCTLYDDVTAYVLQVFLVYKLLPIELVRELKSFLFKVKLAS